MSTVLVEGWMESFVTDATHPNGSKSRDVPPILPLCDMVEVGCHAFDFSARGREHPTHDDRVRLRRVPESAGHDHRPPPVGHQLTVRVEAAAAARPRAREQDRWASTTVPRRA
jgi:hypothetical protein